MKKIALKILTAATIAMTFTISAFAVNNSVTPPEYLSYDPENCLGVMEVPSEVRIQPYPYPKDSASFKIRCLPSSNPTNCSQENRAALEKLLQKGEIKACPASIS